MQLLQRRPVRLPDLQTVRLRLIAITPALLAAEERELLALAKELPANVPAGWPPEHWDAHVRSHIQAQLQTLPQSVGWHRYLVLTDASETLVGCMGAFPCAAGDVELGYSVVDAFQRQGLGTEAVQMFVAWLLERPEIRSVSAQTFETLPQSIKVMQRAGMKFVGPGDQQGTVKYRRWI